MLCNTTNQNKSYRNIYLWEYCILLALSVLFLLFFSLWTSPYYTNWYGGDSSFFTMVGRGMLEGMAPYRDFFDLKGPYLFFIEALGQFLYVGRYGIFLVQIPFLFVSLIFVYKTALLFIPKKKFPAVLFIFLYIYIATLWGGNTLEEFCLPFNMACVYFAAKFFSNSKQPLSPLAPSVYGISFGFMLFSKVTVAAPVIGICIALFFFFIFYKRLQELFLLIVFFIAGLLASAIPVFAYCAYENIFKDMWYAIFEFAFLRSIDYGESFNLSWELKLSGCIAVFLFALLHKKELHKQLRYLLIVVSITLYLLLHLGTPYIYYFTTTLPLIVLAVSLFLSIYNPVILFSSFKEAVVLIAMGICLLFYHGESKHTVKTIWESHNNVYYEEYYEACLDLASLIPQWERNQVYGINMSIPWFEINEILPSYKYQINFPFFIALNPSIETDICNYLIKTPPKWIVAEGSYAEQLPSIATILAEKYTIISVNSAGQLLLLNE